VSKSRSDLLLASGVATLASALAVFRWSQRVVVFDDAYISFRYAKNLVNGAGLVFNEGERIEGYTNFAWTLLSAAGIAAGFDPLTTTRVVGVISYAAIAATLTFLWFRWTENDIFRWLGFPALWLIFARTGFAAHAGSGLETMTVALMILWVGVAAFELEVPWWASGLLAGVLCTVRADAALAVGVVGLILLLRARLGGEGWVAGFKLASRWASIPFAFIAAHTLFRLVYYGEPLPNTYFAKAGGIYALERGAWYVATVVRARPEVGALLVAALIGLLLSRGRSRAVISYGLLYAALYALYLIKVGGDFMEYRFMWMVYPTVMLAGLRGLVVIGDRKLVAGAVGAALMVGLTFTQRPTEKDSLGLPVMVGDRYGFQSLEGMNSMVETEGIPVGKKLGEVLPRDTVVATTLAGTISYYSDLRIVDQWGLNEPYVRHQEAPPTYLRGHVKPAPMEYLKEAGVDLYMHHPTICKCSKPCRERKPNVFIRLGEDRCVRTWYFQQTPELTAYVCEHPEWFVLHRVKCGSSKR
jgi:arabinofuranosyltransferase